MTLTEVQIRERLEAIMYGNAEADHEFTMELRYLAEGRRRGDDRRSALLDRALLLELDDDRAEATPAVLAQEFLELLGPPS